jgi:hypothetical protein
MEQGYNLVFCSRSLRLRIFDNSSPVVKMVQQKIIIQSFDCKSIRILRFGLADSAEPDDLTIGIKVIN